jgi:hypothetical protein
MRPSTSVKIEILCQEFRNSRKKLEDKITKSIKKALAEFDYESCPCVCLGDDRLNYVDEDGIHRVVNTIKLVPVEKCHIQTKERKIVLIAEGVCEDPDYDTPKSIDIEASQFDPLDVLDCIGKVAEKMEIKQIFSSL